MVPVGRQHVLGPAGRVLRGTPSNQLGIVVVEEVIVQSEVLVLGQYGVIRFKLVLVEQSLIANGLNVYKNKGLVLKNNMSCLRMRCMPI